MNAYEALVNEYNTKINTVYNDQSLTASERFIQQIQLKFAYEEPIATALLAEMFA